jgi:hypothetical protein
MTENPSQYSTSDLYEVIILGPLTQIYSARVKSELPDWMSYSNLLIDKFAIHSSSFFHLSKGIIEHKKSGEKSRMNGYDLFTVNTTLRAIIETYITFHNLFIEPKSEEENKFRFLLWKLDGLYEKRKYDIENNDFIDAEKILRNDDKLIDETQVLIENTNFYKSSNADQIFKIYKPNKRFSNWKFLIKNEQIKPQKIIDLIKHICPQRAFSNLYRYTSIHSHSNFPAIAEFKDKRGKMITERNNNAITNVALNLTCLLIYDICSIDQNAKQKFDTFTPEIKIYINGIVTAIRQSE